MSAVVPDLTPVAEPAEYAHIERPACFDEATWARICRLNEAAVAAAPPLDAHQRQVIRDAFHTPVVH